MARTTENTWEDLPLDVLMVQPNFAATGKRVVIARFATTKDAQAMQRCFWRKGLELRTAAGKLLANDKPARRKRHKRKRAKASTRESARSST